MNPKLARSTLRRLSAMPDVHHVAVFHDVLFAFQAQRAAGARFGFGAGFQQLVPVDGFRANEVMFQIGVDCAGGIRRPSIRAPPSRRGTRLRRR